MSKEHAQNTMGQLISSSAQRDAIHIALAPVQAKEPLIPGCQVSADGSLVGPCVGIVDPFLPYPVRTGDWFWLFLYPNTITGLSHRWSHPAFPDEVSDVDEGKALITEVAAICGKTYNAFVDDIEGYKLTEDYIHDNSERYKNVPDDLLKQMWPVFERVTGVKPPENCLTYNMLPYSCSC